VVRCIKCNYSEIDFKEDILSGVYCKKGKFNKTKKLVTAINHLFIDHECNRFDKLKGNVHIEHLKGE